MLNHAATLLANLPYGAVPAGWTRRFAIDPSFMPVRVPAALQRVVDALFGVDADACMRMSRANSLVRIAQATDLADRLLDFDTRLDMAPPRIAVRPRTPSLNGSTLFRTGDDTVEYGRLLRDYDLVLADGGYTLRDAAGIEITISQPAPGSRLIPLYKSGWSLIAGTGDASYRFAWAAPERLSIGKVLVRVENCGAASLAALLDTNDPVYGDIFRKETSAPLRLAAIALALVAALEPHRPALSASQAVVPADTEPLPDRPGFRAGPDVEGHRVDASTSWGGRPYASVVYEGG